MANKTHGWIMALIGVIIIILAWFYPNKWILIIAGLIVAILSLLSVKN